MKKRALKFVVIAITISFLVVLIGNFTPLQYLLGEPIIHVYHYTNDDGSFDEIEVPEKGRDIEMVRNLFEEHCHKAGKTNDTLYRTSSRNLFKFWRWVDYLLHPRWDLPYKKISEL
jgi:hypothetical protein